MFGSAVLLLLLIWGQDTVWSVRLVELRVPAHEREGGTALLGCQYDLEGDELYSVKWYKDNHEFYRYIPKSDTPIFAFKRPGVNVDKSRSSSTVVFLEGLTNESAGLYACEVSGEAPNFITARNEKRINIHYIPEHGPRVTGLKEKYLLDELVVANCSSPASHPVAHLKWLINDEPVPQADIGGPWYFDSNERPKAKEALLQLRFIAAPKHFVNGAIRLKCQATIAPLYQRETKSIHYLALPFEVNERPTILASSVSDQSSGFNAKPAGVLFIFTVLPLTMLLIA